MAKQDKRRTLLFASLSIVAALLIIFGPLFLGKFELNILTRSMTYALIAITVDLLWGYAGVLTFGQAAFFGIGAYAAALILNYFGASPAFLFLALIAAIILPMIIAYGVAWLSFYHASTPLYATVISLILPIIVTQIILSAGTFTGSSSGLVGYDTLALSLSGYFWLTGACLLIVAIAALIFVRSDAGRLLIAIRDNENRLSYLGVNPVKIKILLMTVLAGVCGLAGFLYANSSGIVAPENAGFIFSTELVIWTALGGRATILGPILSTLGIDYLSANLSGDLPFLWQLIIGTIFVVMIIAAPKGVASLFSRLFPKANTVTQTLSFRQKKLTTQSKHPLLAVKNLAKSYGSLSVLSDINLTVCAGELVSIVGPNGAGKTTLMKCLSDGTETISGTIHINATLNKGLVPTQIVALGVGRKFQIASTFDSLTVGQCLRIARTRSEKNSLIAAVTQLALPEAAYDILKLTALADKMNTPVKQLSHGQRQGLELAMVVCLEPQLILLDEPTAGLTKTERSTIGHILKKLTHDMGYAVILVEHDLDFVREISSRMVVLHQGKLVLDGSVQEVVNSATVRDIYSGAAHG